MARYITVADVRATGFDDTVPYAYDDTAVENAIDLWQQVLERMCRQWFESRALVLSVDGNDADTLPFGVPIIDITYVKLNGDTTSLPTDQYEVYNGRQYPDDRRNPRIKLAKQSSPSIYSGANSDAKFRKGRKNQEISGTFGFLEPDDTTPLLIKRALTKLVIEKLSSPIFGTFTGGTPNISVGTVLEEWTDGHRLKYGNPSRLSGNQFKGITTDPEILEAVKLYKAPIGIATPSGWSN
jgi:hypothetical protein